ncbi:unnamed protein product, partial [Didymodactylos carnosus]
RQAQQKYLMAAHEIIENCCSQLNNEWPSKQTNELKADQNNNDNNVSFEMENEPYEEQQPELKENDSYNENGEKHENYTDGQEEKNEGET